jgi:3-keto-disaccharide hydrolase
MSRHFTFAIAVVLAVALAPLVAQKPATDGRQKNQVQPTRLEQGWIQLFNGRDLTGWRGYNQPDATKTSWHVENGLLTIPATGVGDTKGRRDLITDATYEQFDLRWEWKISLVGNSGVKYFVVEDRPDAIGHEYQMIDDERHPDAKIGPHRQTASFYDVFPPHDRPMRPAGEWNSSEVIVKGKHVTHILNGKSVLEYDMESPALVAAIEKSKFKGIDRFSKLIPGHILVQDHGDAVWFRKIEIQVFK